MSLFNLIILVILAFVLSFFFEVWMRKKTAIQKPEGAAKYVNQYHKFGEILFSFLFAIGLLFIHQAFPQLIVYLFVLFIVIYYGFAYVMQWKYMRASKEHIVTLVTGIFLLLFIAVTVSIISFL